MVSVTDYLKKLLFQYDCVVVPELGGFLLHYTPAAYNGHTQLYLPPRKKIAFNEALKLDDGLLVNYMMLHEGLTREEVYTRIHQFVSGLKVEIRQQGSATVEGLGLFTENEESSLQFDPELRHNFHGESYGFQPVAVQPISTGIVPAEAEPAVIPLPVVQPKGDIEVVEAEEVVEVRELVDDQRTHSIGRRPYLAWAATLLLVGSLGVMSYLNIQRSPGQAFSSLNPLDFLRATESEPAKTTKAATTVAPKPAIIPKKEPAPPVVIPTPVTEVPAETPAAAPASIQPSAAPVAPLPAPVIAPAQPRYLAVAGSFALKRNARKLVRILRRDGFKSAYILSKVRKNELYKVVAVGSTDRAEVAASLDKIKTSSGVRAWIHQL